MMELDVPEGSSVFQVIQRVVEIGGAPLRDLVLEKGAISGNLIVMLNKHDVSTLGGTEILVSEGDEVVLLPHVQGG
jgi:molybdopterin converting factor small subunit